MGSIIFSTKEDAGPKNLQPPGVLSDTYGPIRSSVIVLTLQIIALLLFTDVVYAFTNYFFLRVHFLNLALPFDLHHSSMLILALIHILKTILQLYFIVQIVLKWTSQTYYIIGGHLVKREGVITIKEKSYDLKNIRAVTVRQTILGKLFRFGDVVVETSASGGYMDRFVIVGISNPQMYERMLLHQL